jgi:succinate dehydrogenase / fumarate reductase membrane anchor subunit
MSKTKNYGSHHWVVQRLSAIVLLPLLAWLIYQVNNALLNFENIGLLITNPINITLFMMVVIIAFYHAVLGLQVIFEDYVHCKCLKVALNVITYFITVFTIIITLFAVITVHLL